MWIFTDFGFFSIVKDAQTPGNLLVRARRRDDLVRFSVLLHDGRGLALGYKADIRCTPGADYLWKLSAPQSEVAVLLAEIAADIDYTNFKGQCVKTGHAAGLHDVWEVMAKLQVIPPYASGPVADAYRAREDAREDAEPLPLSELGSTKKGRENEMTWNAIPSVRRAGKKKAQRRRSR